MRQLQIDFPWNKVGVRMISFQMEGKWQAYSKVLLIFLLFKLLFVRLFSYFFTSLFNYLLVKYEVLTAVNLKNVVYWDVMQCSSSKNRRFGGTYRLHHESENNQLARNNVSSN
jgi:hypothetical protein